MIGRASLAALAFAMPALAGALEPRLDHRDTAGVFAEAIGARDTVAISGRTSASSWRPAARLAFGFDVSGEGDEIVVGGTIAVRSFRDPEDERVLLGLDVRYRGYFGTEEAKTFFDAGVWAPFRSRLAVGPLVGLGVAYDFSRSAGVYVAGTFATAFGEARVASLSLAVGAQLRFELR